MHDGGRVQVSNCAYCRGRQQTIDALIEELEQANKRIKELEDSITGEHPLHGQTCWEVWEKKLASANRKNELLQQTIESDAANVRAGELEAQVRGLVGVLQRIEGICTKCYVTEASRFCKCGAEENHTS